MNSHLDVRTRRKYCGVVWKVLYLLVKYCVHLFFFFFNCRNAVAFFAVWRVSIFNEACWLILRLCYCVRNYFLVFYDYPRCNTCSLSEWLCSRRSRIVCDTFFFYYLSVFTCSYNCCWQPFKLPILLYHFTRGGTKLIPFYVEFWEKKCKLPQSPPKSVEIFDGF